MQTGNPLNALALIGKVLSSLVSVVNVQTVRTGQHVINPFIYNLSELIKMYNLFYQSL